MPHAMLMNDTVMPNRRPLADRRAGDEVLIRDSNAGQVHFLSASAAVIWECCDGSTTAGQCAEKLRTHFDVPKDAPLLEDIQTTVSSFSDRGLLESV